RKYIARLAFGPSVDGPRPGAKSGIFEMFAVIRSGGKQYRVAKDEVITVERLKGEVGETLRFAEVLLLGGDSPRAGTPLVAGATVQAEIVEHGRGDKVVAFKKKRRKNT